MTIVAKNPPLKTPWNMNITNEQFDEVTDALNAVDTCEASCMIQKRKDNGLPEIEDCPELIDYQIYQLRPHETVITKSQYKYLTTKVDENYMFSKSIWYKLYRFFN